MGGRLHALAHGVRQKFAHFGVAAGAAVRGVDATEVERLDASGQRRCEAAAFALCDECAAGGVSGGGGDRVNHESAVLAGCPGGLGASVEALALLVGLEVIPLVCDEAEDLLCGVRPPGELREACGEKGV